jgi:hypothetical protein
MSSDVNRTRFTDRLGIAPELACHLAPRAPGTTATTSDITSRVVLNVVSTCFAGTRSTAFFAVAALPTGVRTPNSP